MSMFSDKPVAPSQAIAKRIGAGIVKIERTVFAPAPPFRSRGLQDDGQQLAITAGAIPSRSGATAGMGSVEVVTPTVDPSTGICTLATESTTLTVYNFSGATGGIASGKYCWIGLYYGVWWIVSVEC